jgi:hypothetical protein
VTGLLCCPGCGWYTAKLVTNRCGNCRRGWETCPVHGRLEHAGTDHRRVTVAEVVVAVPLVAGRPPLRVLNGGGS